MPRLLQWHRKGNSYSASTLSKLRNCSKSLSEPKYHVVVPSLQILSFKKKKKIKKSCLQVSSYFKIHQGWIYFPKYPLLFQWPRELTGEKGLQSAKKNICVPFAWVTTLITKILFSNWWAHMVCNLGLKLFFWTTGLIQYTFYHYIDVSILHLVSFAYILHLNDA